MNAKIIIELQPKEKCPSCNGRGKLIDAYQQRGVSAACTCCHKIVSTSTDEILDIIEASVIHGALEKLTPFKVAEDALDAMLHVDLEPEPPDLREECPKCGSQNTETFELCDANGNNSTLCRDCGENF
jgi:uncharacterized protein (DUF983 family)